ncbi:MAG TPA: hypothetical protein VNO30_34600 [Kofleriaceae bacterium]|nr:hypothetical protein [Kofleriaceae bacterium]
MRVTRLWVVLVLVACGQPATPPPLAPDHQPRAAEACALPRGVTLQELEPRERGLVLRRIFACNDLRLGRITQADYVRTVAAIDAEWGSMPESKPAPRRLAWASSVQGVSSQYGDPSWAATQVLGPPNVFPRHGDVPQAWASRGPDDPLEWIAVGFTRASSISAVVVYETFNPGAIVRVTLTAEGGASFEVPVEQADEETSPEGSVRRRFELPCTPYRVRTVRLELDSSRVAGWNEIDAIGIAPCEL